MAYSSAQKLATMKYTDTHYDQLRITVPKGERERYKQIAAARGFSLAAMIRKSVEEFAVNHPPISQ